MNSFLQSLFFTVDFKHKFIENFNKLTDISKANLYCTGF